MLAPQLCQSCWVPQFFFQYQFNPSPTTKIWPEFAGACFFRISYASSNYVILGNPVSSEFLMHHRIM